MNGSLTAEIADALDDADSRLDNQPEHMVRKNRRIGVVLKVLR